MSHAGDSPARDSSSNSRREDVNNVHPVSENTIASAEDQQQESNGLGNARNLEDCGDKSPDIDEAILAEIVDEDDTPEERAKKETLVRRLSGRYRGPLPLSSEFRAYGEVEPTAPKVILEMAMNSNQAVTNRINAEADAIRAGARTDEKAVPRGQLISGGLILVLLLLAGMAIYLDRPWSVAMFGIGGLGLMFMNTLPSILNREAEVKKQIETSGEDQQKQ